MYVCPFCKKTYEEEDKVAKCLMDCWRKTNPVHDSKNAPRSEDRVERQCDEDVLSFFENINKGEIE